MLDWLLEYSDLMHVVIAFGTMLVWIFYAHLLMTSYRRHLRPKVLINQEIGSGLTSRCLISNMSREPIHIDVIFGVLETDQGRYTAPVTDREQPGDGQDALDAGQGSSQGPLQTGEHRDIGSFRDLMTRIARLRDLPLSADGYVDTEQLAIHSIEVQVVAIYGPEDMPMGARRHFSIRRDGRSHKLKSETPDTQQMISRRERRQVRAWFTRTQWE